VKKATSFSNEMIRVLREEPLLWIGSENEEVMRSVIATAAYELSLFGFSSLANFSMKLLRKNPFLGYLAMVVYRHYIVAGYLIGIGGFRMYDRVDLEAMIFFRILKKRGLLTRFLGAIKKEEKGAPPLEEETIMASPAGFSVVGRAVELPIVARFDVDDLRSSLKRERDKELEKNMLEAMRAFQSYDFAKFREKNETINEI
jgi:hypothetical protein